MCSHHVEFRLSRRDTLGELSEALRRRTDSKAAARIDFILSIRFNPYVRGSVRAKKLNFMRSFDGSTVLTTQDFAKLSFRGAIFAPTLPPTGVNRSHVILLLAFLFYSNTARSAIKRDFVPIKIGTRIQNVKVQFND